MDLRDTVSVSLPREPVEHHSAIVVEFRELVPVEQKPVLRSADYLHICLEHLRGVILDEYQWNMMRKSVFFTVLHHRLELLKGAEHQHGRSFSFLLWLLD